MLLRATSFFDHLCGQKLLSETGEFLFDANTIFWISTGSGSKICGTTPFVLSRILQFLNRLKADLTDLTIRIACWLRRAEPAFGGQRTILPFRDQLRSRKSLENTSSDALRVSVMECFGP